MKQAIRTNINFDASLYEEAKTFAKERGLTLTKLVEIALDQYIRNDLKQKSENIVTTTLSERFKALIEEGCKFSDLMTFILEENDLALIKTVVSKRKGKADPLYEQYLEFTKILINLEEQEGCELIKKVIEKNNGQIPYILKLKEEEG